MPDFPGLSPVPSSLQGLSQDRPALGAAMQRRETQAALGRTLGAGGLPLTGRGIDGAAGAEAADRVARNPAGAADLLPPDPDPPAGPPPAFDITPLEKLRKPPPMALGPPDKPDPPPDATQPPGSMSESAPLSGSEPTPTPGHRGGTDAGPYAEARLASPDPEVDLRH